MLALRCDTGWKAKNVTPRLSISSAINQTNANNKTLSIDTYGIFTDNYRNINFTDIGAINAYSKLQSYFYFYNSNSSYSVISKSLTSPYYNSTTNGFITDRNHCFFVGVAGSLWSDVNLNLNVSFVEYEV